MGAMLFVDIYEFYNGVVFKSGSKILEQAIRKSYF